MIASESLEHIIDVYSSAFADLSFFTNHAEWGNYFTNPTQESLEALEDEFANLSEVRRVYKQVRFIDASGQ